MWLISDLSNKRSTHFILFGKFFPSTLFYLRKLKKVTFFHLHKMFQVHVYLHHHSIREIKIGVYVTIYTALISRETLHKTKKNETSEKNLVKPKRYILNFFCDFKFALPNEPISIAAILRNSYITIQCIRKYFSSVHCGNHQPNW